MSATTDSYEEVLERFDPVFGIEVHVELNTQTKLFCGCANGFGAEPNTQVCPVCLGLPGSLPVTNAKAVESAIRLGLALGCSIRESSRFARKNYFYPDLAKDYQISQYDEPTCYDGAIDVILGDGTTVTIGIERAHIEEDAGKNTHVGGTGGIQGADYSLVDYNRGGVPLVEIVTKPVTGMGLRTAEVARAYVATIRDIVKALGISDGRMEQGSLRADVNLSLRPQAGPGGDQNEIPFGKRSETKNVNSLRAIEKAIHFEVARQGALLSAGKAVTQETRHWHEDTNSTTPGRSKEEADDYRYFPEPDLMPVEPTEEWIEELRATLPEHPGVIRARLQAEWGFADLEMRDVVAADAVGIIEDTVAAGASPQAARKWWMGELARIANETGTDLADLPVTPEDVAELQDLVASGALNDKLARQALAGTLAGEGSPRAVAEARGLAIVSDGAALESAVDAALASQPDVLAKIQDGKVQAAGAIVGAVMKATGGQADAALVRAIILRRAGVEG
ncbi:MAG: Asp-tRNA(Asn)/Glu-tRNA(Gln) amidotransferase subunit GatB [Demequinaceae bacterium]|nr:Asp-tRNA(Asn)/Glu-tRNA(Gln) amidotransferase subunit GatB [Demequinaceae bacterium]